MTEFNTRPSKKMHLLLFEQRYDFSDYRQLYGVCAWCGDPGGDGFQPYILRAKKTANWGVLEMHEWLFKRSANLPKSITFALENMILLHKICHSRYGQTKAMTKKCYNYKKHFYDLQKWVNEVEQVTNISPINLEDNYGDDTMTQKPKYQPLLFVDIQTAFNNKYSNLVQGLNPQLDSVVGLDMIITWPISQIKDYVKRNLFAFYSQGLHTGLIELEKSSNKPRAGLIKELEVPRQNEYNKITTKLATTPQLVKIVSMGFAWFAKGEIKTPVLVNDSKIQNQISKSGLPIEAYMIKKFWDGIGPNTTICAYSLGSFVLPVIMAKTAQIPPELRAKYDIKPKIFDTAPWKNDILDLRYKIFGKEYKTLDWAYEAYLGKPLGNNATGADIPTLYEAGNVGAIKDYSKSRLRACAELYLRCEGLYSIPYILDDNTKKMALENQVKANLPSSFKDPK